MMSLDIAQVNLDMACETGNHILFMRSMYEVSRTIPIENIFSICLTQAEICLQNEKYQEAKEMISLLWNSSQYFHIGEAAYKPLDLIPFKNTHFYYIPQAVNKLLEAATKMDSQWQRSILIDAFQRMTLFRIIDYRLSTFPNTQHSETWNMPTVIEFRKTIFRDFRRTLSIEYGLF